MVKFGVFTQDQFNRIPHPERPVGAHVNYSLLDVGRQPTPEQVHAFEKISFSLRTSNGTFRTTFRNRFADVNQAALTWMTQLFPATEAVRIQDRAVSHGLTPSEWAAAVFPVFPHAEFEASDLLVELIALELQDGSIYIFEPNGVPLQYSHRPFVVPLHHLPSWRYPVNRWIAGRGLQRLQKLKLPSGWMATSEGPGYRVRRIPYLHPEAQALSAANPSGFQYRQRSVFDHTPSACDVLRTMNILNWAYFSEAQMAEGIRAVWDSLAPGGLWIVGRTSEEDFSNHVTFLRRPLAAEGPGWEVLQRLGKGSEIESFAMGNAWHSPK